MKVIVLGVERMEGVSKEKEGRAGGKQYAIGKVHAACVLDTARNGEKSLAKGAMGTTYDVDVELVRRIEHNTFPFHAELLIEDVMRFGKREGKVMEVRPLQAANAGTVQKAA